MGIAERVARLEELHLPKVGSVPHVVIFHGVPVRRLRCEGRVWDRREDESEPDFISRVVVEAAMGPGHWVVFSECS